MSPDRLLLQGTLELMVLKALTLGAQHGWGLSQRIEELSGEAFAVNQGAIYPALQRLRAQGWITAKWGTTEQNRRARFYALTAAGRKRLEREIEWWQGVVRGVNGVLQAEPESRG